MLAGKHTHEHRRKMTEENLNAEQKGERLQKEKVDQANGASLVYCTSYVMYDMHEWMNQE